jgi:hypothetical protein
MTDDTRARAEAAADAWSRWSDTKDGQRIRRMFIAGWMQRDRDVGSLLAENARLSALIDTAKALNEALNTPPARLRENAGNGPWCIHQDCAHWFEKQCDESCKVLAAPDPKENP